LGTDFLSPRDKRRYELEERRRERRRRRISSIITRTT